MKPASMPTRLPRSRRCDGWLCFLSSFITRYSNGSSSNDLGNLALQLAVVVPKSQIGIRMQHMIGQKGICMSRERQMT